jgi:hypothetical protein
VNSLSGSTRSARESTKPLTYNLWYVLTFTCSNPHSLSVSTLDRYSHIWYSFPLTSIETSEVNFTEPRANCDPASRIYLEWWLWKVMVVRRSGTRLQSGQEVGDRPWMKGTVVTPNGSRASCRETLQPDDMNNLSGFCVTQNSNAGQFCEEEQKSVRPLQNCRCWYCTTPSPPEVGDREWELRNRHL